MKQNIFLMADLHGAFKPVRELRNRNPWLQQAQTRGEENVLIILGDSGINFFLNERDEEFKKKLGKYPFIYFVVRGNHDQRPSILAKEHPDEWTTELFFGNFVIVEKKYPYIKYAKDIVDMYFIPYSENENLSTLIIPGAYSVDKYRRLQMGWSWFPEEELSEQEKKDGLELLNAELWKCDLVFSHTCPTIYEPTDLFLPTIDQSMVDKSMERYLGQIEHNLDYKLWCWGHFHQPRIYPEYDGKQCVMIASDKAFDLIEWVKKGEIVWR